MAKQKLIYKCENCGHENARWLGRCPECGEWNSLIELTVFEEAAKKKSPIGIAAIAEPLSGIEYGETERFKTGIFELDRVLGGGLVKGSVVLIGGDPGIGKSTLLLEACDKLTTSCVVMYVTGEESREQIKLRAKRLDIKSDILILSKNDISAIMTEAERIHPNVLVIDSIQTMVLGEILSSPGSTAQIRETANLLITYAKETGCAVFLAGHVTKDGMLAGPKMLEHMVDTVLYFEGDRHDSLRLLRAVKNRFGSTNEIGVFEMGDTGIIEVADPSRMFISGRDEIGSATTCALEGTRPILVEIQALIANTPFNNPRRMAAGMEINRLVLLIAVLEKKAGLQLYNKDVYTNVVGNLRINDRASDMACAVAIASALIDVKPKENSAFIGEIGLTGELRRVGNMEKRVRECLRMGYKTIFIPRLDKKLNIDDPGIIELDTAMDAINLAFS